MVFLVTTGLPEEIYQLMDLFPETVQQSFSVQYVTIPYKRVGEREDRIIL